MKREDGIVCGGTIHSIPQREQHYFREVCHVA